MSPVIDTSKLLEIALKNINVPGLGMDTLDLVLKPALDKVVADTATPIDDVLAAAIYPVLRAELEKLLTELWQGLNPSPAV